MNWKPTTGALAAALILAAGACSHDTPAARGQRDFERLGCSACHTKGPGPDLAKLIQIQDPKFLERFISDPSAVYEQRGMRPLNEGYTLMPDMHATPQDAREIVAYLESLDRRHKGALSP